ncbi:hypothetical protein [Amycolatopsis magusensis]|uniref:Cortical protein marker for cell polarity n=1 Tax=Amycolatopsis magusensis TaxID=882444 RepID=A0ABS4PXU4_9PSEU|nr:hypothetical protein [Amycolatopsis magusensis]MBP2183668.1 hypothetical protein [Amycolatopsis magusensis]
MKSALGTVAALAVVVASAGQADAAPGGWEVIPAGSESANLVSVTATAADDLWTAGFGIRREVSEEGNAQVFLQPQARHWDGTAWSVVATAPLDKGVSGQFQAIAASATDQVWAVGGSWRSGVGGGRSLIERWDGTAWSGTPADDVPDADNVLFGVASVGATDAWAVGSASRGRAEPVAQHWDGVRWTRVPLPADLGDAVLSAVAAGGPADVWAAGYLTGDPVSGRPSEPLVLHWDGVSWSRVALPSTTGLGMTRVGAITVAHGQVWVVGSSTTGGAVNRKPLALRVDRRGAVIERTPDEQGQLNGVTVVGHEVWAVGYQYDDAGKPHSYALRREPGGTWRRAPAPEVVGGTLFGVTAVPGTGTLWTTGAMDGAEPGLPSPLIARLPKRW